MTSEPQPRPDVSDTARRLSDGIALYVHIPFCETKCPYCDFNTYAGIGHLLPPYLSALHREIAVWGEALGRPLVNTVFLGGGTPSLLAPPQMAALLDAVRAAFRVAGDAEVTAEVNPDDASPSRMAAFRAAGVNRVSLGVQSLDDGELALLGRRHSAADALSALAAIRGAGFDNVSADLMYGLPYQLMASWQRTLEGVLGAGVQHCSAYALTLEEGTPMHRQAEDGTLPEQDQDLTADMYQWADETLESARLGNYEISNWAQPGRESRHNRAYWRNTPYLGVGPGAHSFLGGYRFANLRSPTRYIALAGAWTAPAGGVEGALRGKGSPVDEVTAIDARTEMADTVILGLRLREGVTAGDFAARHGVGLRSVYGGAVDEGVALGLLRATGDGDGERLQLTPRGRLLANEAFVRFLMA